MHALIAAVLLCAEPSIPTIPQPPDYFSNSWATVGLKDYLRGTRLSPANELILSRDRRLRLRIGPEGKPVGRGPRKTLLEGYLPVVILESSEAGISYRFRIWASPLPGVVDWRAAFDGPTEGENYLNWIAVEARNPGGAPARATFVAELLLGGQESREIVGLDLELPAGSSREAVVRVPFEPIEDQGALAEADAGLWLERTVGFWKGLLASGATFEVPEGKALQTLLASHVNQLIGNDHGEVHAGEGFYDEFYIRDGAYQVLQLEEAGFMEAARKAMLSFLKFQKPDGQLESQAGQLDANGQGLWALWQFWKITGDAAWLKSAYPTIRQAAIWIRETLRRTPGDSPFAGLLPAAVADGEFLWDGKHHIVGYDFWNLRGLLCAADAAGALGEAADAEAFAAEARAYRGAIDAAWKRTGLPHFPPSWEKVGTHWGNTETLWPTAVFDRDDPRVTALLKEVRESFGGGFHEGTIRWCPDRLAAIHPYMSSYTTLASLALGQDEKVVEEFYWYLLHSTAAHSFPEGVYYKRRFAWGDTMPHLLGAANYAVLLRHMLIHEEGDGLHLLGAVPDAWLAAGKTIRVERAPTHFGEVALMVKGTQTGVNVKLGLPKDPARSPKRVLLHLPSSRRPVEVPAGVSVVLRPDQKVPWSFEHVARLYYGSLPVEEKMAGLVALPLKSPLPEGKCRLLDLSAAATTNPFKAPFCVENPGNFLFTGLKVGLQTSGGVPFQIVDPASNEGKGLVVLEGFGACARLPKQVVLPVGAKGKRLFFLGNVHGWNPEDEGVGDSGALAEYVIRYADGTEQVLPLISGRTTDDWATAPEIADVFVGLEGDPWHLYVLGLELRPLEVKEIVFRDLGTSSSPVLAAVTLELAD